MRTFASLLKLSLVLSALVLFSLQSFGQNGSYGARKPYKHYSNDEGNTQRNDSYRQQQSQVQPYQQRRYNRQQRQGQPYQPSSPRAYRGSNQRPSVAGRPQPYRRQYKPEFKQNYRRYKSYSPDRKRRVQKKWSSFKQNSKWKQLSPAQKSRLRKRVIKKKRRY